MIIYGFLFNVTHLINRIKEKEEKVGAISLPKLKTYIATVFKTVWNWWRNRLADQ